MKKYYKLALMFFILMILAFLISIVSIVLTCTINPLWSLLLIIGLIMVVSMYLFYKINIHKVKPDIPYYLYQNGISIKYQYEPSFTQMGNILNKSKLINNSSDLIKEVYDSVEGTFEKIPYTLFDFSCSDPNDEYNIKGTCFRIKLNNQFNTNIILKQKKNYIAYEGTNLNILVTDSTKFNDYFIVKADNHYEAVKIFSWDTMGSLLKLSSKYESFALSIINEYIYVIIDDKKHFKPSIFGYKVFLNDFNRLIGLVSGIVDAFKK